MVGVYVWGGLADPQAHRHVEEDHDGHGDEEEEQGRHLKDVRRAGTHGAHGGLWDQLQAEGYVPVLRTAVYHRPYF